MNRQPFSVRNYPPIDRRPVNLRFRRSTEVAHDDAPPRDSAEHLVNENKQVEVLVLAAGWKPVCVGETRQNRNREPRSDCIGTEKPLILYTVAMQIVTVGVEPTLGAFDMAADASTDAPEPR